MAGPCAVESRELLFAAAQAVATAGAVVLRGGAFKPRTSPDSFQGLGEPGLVLLAEASRLTGLPVVTEVIDPRDVPLVAGHAAILQVGSRDIPELPAVARGRPPAAAGAVEARCRRDARGNLCTRAQGAESAARATATSSCANVACAASSPTTRYPARPRRRAGVAPAHGSADRRRSESRHGRRGAGAGDGEGGAGRRCRRAPDRGARSSRAGALRRPSGAATGSVHHVDGGTAPHCADGRQALGSRRVANRIIPVDRRAAAANEYLDDEVITP